MVPGITWKSEPSFFCFIAIHRFGQENILSISKAVAVPFDALSCPIVDTGDQSHDA